MAGSGAGLDRWGAASGVSRREAGTPAIGVGSCMSRREAGKAPALNQIKRSSHLTEQANQYQSPGAPS